MVNCIICGKEFIKSANNQKYCSKKCYNKKFNREYNEYKKKYQQEHKEEAKEYNRKYQQEHKEEAKEYQQEHKEEAKEYQKKYEKTLKGKITRKKASSKRRNLKFNPLNKYFEESEAHHIDEINVIYIPTILHKSIWHDLKNNINMNEINLKAWDFLESSSY